MPTSHTAKLFAAGVKAALDKKFSLKDYLIKTKGHTPEEVAAYIAAAKAELEDD